MTPEETKAFEDAKSLEKATKENEKLKVMVKSLTEDNQSLKETAEASSNSKHTVVRIGGKDYEVNAKFASMGGKVHNLDGKSKESKKYIAELIKSGSSLVSEYKAPTEDK